MNQSAIERDFVRAQRRHLCYGPIEDDLAEVEQLLAEQLRSPYPYLDELVRYGCMLGGKRLRPALLLCSARAAGQILPAHTTLAAAVEMIHTATLVHDDVLDGASTRRHLATVNSRWDDEAAILLGDFLFTHAFSMVCSLGEPYAAETVAQTSRAICEGELRQKGRRGDFSLDEVTYLDIIQGKTAELCACSSRLGAYCSGADEGVTRALSRYGRSLGIAFQIADDILDLIGDEGQMGKSLGTDLEKRKPTLPVIRLLQVADADDRDLLLRALEGRDEMDLPFLHACLNRYDTIAYARQKAAEHIHSAQRELKAVPGNVARDLLHEVADFAISRVI